MSKVAIRLYINLYTTSDGRPPTNIQLNFNICFDLRSSSTGDEGLVIQGTPIRASPIMIPERIVPPIPIRVRVPESVPIILTIPTTIIKQPDTYDAIDTVPSQIIRDDIPQQRVRIPSVPSIVASIDVDSEMMPDSEDGVDTFPSPIIDEPDNIQVSATISVVDKPIVRQPNVIIEDQQRVVHPSNTQRIVMPSDSQDFIGTIFSPIRKMPTAVVDIQSSVLVQEPVEVPIIEDAYPSKIISSPVYSEPVAPERRLPSKILPYISIEIEKPSIDMIPSPIILSPTISTDSIIRTPIRTAQTRRETCACQCSMSGSRSISIIYDNDQESCTIGLTRKRRHHRYRNRYINSND
ncbi:unnamed protein product [Adineta steineri]|uniref:Uncharacterized protein n=1 Tax=Adineta steineri TaxID=433720 RepID=A0A818Y5T4_9BILA|nr:unnamed protein product [Adineta steineri]